MTSPLRNFLLFLAILSRLHFGQGLCPLDCICDESNLSVHCESPSNLEVVPISLNPDILELNISGTPIKRLDAAFQFYGELRSLDLSFNRITTLEERCFENQVKLVRLDLAYNALSSLMSSKIFYPLPELEYLNLEGNQIWNISSGVLGHLSKLKSLNLRGNHLSSIPIWTFDGITHSLKEINLSNNYLKMVDLRGMSGLGSLDLSNNPLDSFHGLPLNLRELSLASTRNISSTELNAMFSKHRDLRFLDLSSNLLQNGQLPHLISDSLFKLTLSNNSNLIQLDLRESFSQMERLRSLEIRNQSRLQRVVLNLEYFEKLRYLDISHNQNLNSIDFSSYEDLKDNLHQEQKPRSRLREIRLVNNKLRTFFPGHLLHLESLEDIYLGGNPLDCDCHLQWVQEFLLRKERDLIVFCSSLPRNLSSIPKEELICRDAEFQLWIFLGILISVSSFILIFTLVIYTRRIRMNNKKKIVDTNAAPISEDLGTMAGTWHSKSTGMTFLDQNEFIYATPNNGDRIIPAVQERGRNNYVSDYYYYGGGTLPNRYFIQQRHSNNEEDEIFYLP